MSRKPAREIALHSLFTMTYDALSAEEILSDYLSEESRARLSDEVNAYAKPLEVKDEDFIRLMVSGVEQRRAEPEEEIGRRAIKWRTERISRVAGTWFPLVVLAAGAIAIAVQKLFAPSPRAPYSVPNMRSPASPRPGTM